MNLSSVQIEEISRSWPRKTVFGIPSILETGDVKGVEKKSYKSKRIVNSLI